MDQTLSARDEEIVRRLTLPVDGLLKASSALARLLITDGLTGLYNRAYFQERLRSEVAEASPDRSLAVFVIDINHFKDFNDRYGHRVGDLALREVASAMNSVTPERGAACRLGGDEFVVLVPDLAVIEAKWLQLELAQEIGRRQVRADESGLPLRVEASVGLAVAPRDGTDAEALLHSADSNMYALKRRSTGKRTDSVATDWSRAPLVGRTEQLWEANCMMEAAEHGRGSLLLLSGPAGIGKTRLMHEIAEAARKRGFAVVKGAAGSGAPLGAILQGVSDLAALLGRQEVTQLARRYWSVQLAVNRGHLRGGATESDRPTHAQLSEGVRLMLARAAGRCPIIWTLDDIRLADTATVGILEHLAGQLRGLPVFLVAAARVEGDWDSDRAAIAGWWERLSGRKYCRNWPLAPLDQPSSVQLAQWAMGGLVAPVVVDRVVDVAEGNPLLILRLAASHDTLEGDSKSVDLVGVISAELERLPELLRNALVAAAILGYEFVEWVLERVAPEPPESLKHSVEALVAAGWLRREDDRLRFTHPLVQEVVYRSVPQLWRRALHRLAGLALMDVPEHPPADVARHFDEGGDWVQAQRYHRRAGDVAAGAFAYLEAAQHYRRSIHLAEAVHQTPDDIVSLSIQAGELFMRVEDMTSAQHMLQYGLQCCRTAADRGRVMRHLATCHLYNDEPTAATLNAEAINILEPLGPSIDLGVSLVNQVVLDARQGDRASAQARTRDVIQLAQVLGDPMVTVNWVAGVGTSLCWLGEFEMARETLKEATSQLKAIPSSTSSGLARVYLSVGFLACMLGQAAQALRLIRLGRRLAAGSGDTQVTLGASEAEVRIVIATGDLPGALQHLDHIEPLVRSGSSKWRHWWWLAESTRACLYRHDLEGAERFATLLSQLGKGLGLGHDSFLYANGLLSLLQMARGEQPEVADWTVERLLPLRERTLYTSAILALAAQVQLGAGNLDAAQQLIDGARSYLVLLDELPWIEWLQGRILLAGGQVQTGIAALRRAARFRGIAYYRALAYRDLSQLVACDAANRQQREEQERNVARAQELFVRMGNEEEIRRLVSAIEWLAERSEVV